MTKINLYAKYGSDRNKEQKGVPFYIDKESDTYILVGRWTARNVEHFKAQAEVTAKYADLPDGDRDREEARTKAFATHLVTGWNNIVDKDGNELPFTTENAIKLLLDLPDLVNEMVDFALNRANYPIDGIEKTTKNS